MTEALNLFRDICKDKGFKKKPFILFLNKHDQFKEKIKKVDLTVCPSFEDYTGKRRNIETFSNFFFFFFV